MPGNKVWSWGSGSSGQLGHGELQRQLLPKKIEALAGQSVCAVGPWALLVSAIDRVR